MADPKVAVVTGAGKGIGRGIAERLARDGYVVAVTDIDEKLAEEVASEISKHGAAAHPYRLDVSQSDNVIQMFEAVAHDHAPPAALVNNAGIYSDHRFLDLSEEVWNATHNVNLKGAFLCSQTFARMRVRNGGGGGIVNIASTSSISARVGAAHYSSSKAGLVMLTKSTAWELGEYGIRVNAIAPGLIMVNENHGSKDYLAAVMRMIPRGRAGVPPDIANAVAFLLSDAADFMTGECVVIDGGFTSGRPLPLFNT